MNFLKNLLTTGDESIVLLGTPGSAITDKRSSAVSLCLYTCLITSTIIYLITLAG